MSELNDRQQRFVAEYLIDLNATAAYIRAGYSPNGAQQSSSELLLNPVVARAVAEGQAAHLHHADVTAQRVLEEYRRLAFMDARSFWEKVVVGVAFGVPITSVRLKAITDLTPDEGACLAGFEAVIKNAAAGDGQQDLVHKVKFWSKLDALEKLGEHLALFEGDGQQPADVPAFTLPPGTNGVAVH